MPGHADHILRHLHRVAARAAYHHDSDTALLTRFVQDREQAAFAVLVERHGPMVLQVCRRVLGQAQDAEDAFQAVFLVLARKAARIRNSDELAAWLHGVAHRVALKARTAHARRRRNEAGLLAASSPDGGSDPLEELSARELLLILDEEVRRLPVRYRLPLILCYLEGRSREAAARHLGWTLGSLKGRLERGRALLHQRLARRGLAPAAAGGAVLLAGQPSHALPVRLFELATQTAFTATVVPPAIEALAAMAGANAILNRVPVVLLVFVGLFGAGAVSLRPWTTQATADDPAQAAIAPAATPRIAVDAAGDPLPEGAVARMGTMRFRVRGDYEGFALSPDGTVIANANGRIVRLLNASTGRAFRQFTGKKQVDAVAFSANGMLLAAAEHDLIHIWELQSGKEIRQLQGPIQAQMGLQLVFSADGRTLATGNMLGYWDGITRLWDLATGTQRWQCDGTNRPALMLYPLAFEPDGKTLIARELHGTALLFLDAATGREQRRMRLPRLFPQLAITPDARILAAGRYDEPAIHLWDLVSNKELAPLAGASRPYAFSRDGKLLAARSADKSCRIWDITTGKEVHRVGALLGDSRWLAFLPNGNTVAFLTGFENAMRFWDLEGERECLPTGGHRGSVTGLCYTPDGRRLISGSNDDTVRFWEPATGREAQQFSGGHYTGVWNLALAADGRTMATTSGNDTAIRIWDSATGQELRHFQGPRTSKPMAFGSTGTILASSPAKGSPDKPEPCLQLWDAATGRELRHIECSAWMESLAFSPDGNLLAGATGRAVYLWDTATGRERYRLDLPSNSCFHRLQFSPDGKMLAIAGSHRLPPDETGRVILWEVGSRSERLAFDVPSVRVGCLAFSPDGRGLATGGGDHIVRLWDVASGTEVQRFDGHQNAVSCLAFSPDGKHLASGSADSTIVVWKVSGSGRSLR